MCIQEVRLHFLCCHKTRCKVTQLLIRLEWIDPVLNNSSYVLHYSFVILRTFFLTSLCVVLSSVIRGCGMCQFLTLATVLSTVRSKYHPLEDCSRLQAYADDSTLGLGVLLMVTSIVWSWYAAIRVAFGSLDGKLSSNQLLMSCGMCSWQLEHYKKQSLQDGRFDHPWGKTPMGWVSCQN